MKNNWRKLFMILAAFTLTGILVACGGTPSPGGAEAPPPGPDGGSSSNLDRVAGIRFDFSNAVGLQIDNDARVSTLSGGSSNLFKVTRTGGLELALIQGSVYVQDFFIRNGKIYAVFEYDYYSNEWAHNCVLAEINSAGEVFCVDSELVGVDVNSIQFDADGGIYYRGYRDDGPEVIRRSKDGEVTDFYTVTTNRYILDFIVTRYGDLILESAWQGSIGSENSIELIDRNGRVTPLRKATGGEFNFIGILPDGSLLAHTWESEFGSQFFSVLLGESPSIDFQPYSFQGCGSDIPQARIPVCTSDSFVWWELRDAAIWGLSYVSYDRRVAVSQSGVYEIFPSIKKLDLPLHNYTTAEINGNNMVIGGSDAAMQEVLLLLNLENDEFVDILKGRNIQVVSVYFDGNTVFLFGRNLDNNRPILGEYDVRTRNTSFSDIATDVGDGFQVLDWSVSHVAPDPYWVPEPQIAITPQEGMRHGQFEFSARDTKWFAFMDEIHWDFGDGFSASGETVFHQYYAPGSYTVTLTTTSRMGISASISTMVEVEEAQIATVEDFVQGRGESFLLLSNGEVFNWGETTSTYDSNYEEFRPTAKVEFPSGASAITQLARSEQEVFALDELGSVYTWSWNDPTPDPGTAISFKRFPMNGNQDTVVKQVSASENAGVAVTTEGELFAWGLVGPQNSPQKLGGFSGKDIDRAFLGFGRLFAVDVHGNVWAAGNGSNGRLGIGESNDVSFSNPALLTALSGMDIREIAVGREATFALTDQGDLYSWGQNQEGQRGDASTVDQLFPAKMDALPGPVKSIVVNTSRSPQFTAALLDSGEVFTWGRSTWEVPLLADGDEIDRTFWFPARVEVIPPAIDLYASETHISVLDERGALLGWGRVFLPDAIYDYNRKAEPVLIR